MDHEHFDALYPANTRASEIEMLLKMIKAGSSCQLIGLPGVGRSNALGLLQYNTGVRKLHLGQQQENYHFVTVDFSQLRKKPLIDVLKLFFLAIIESLKERRRKEHKDVEKIFKKHVSFNDELVLFHGLKDAVDFLAIEKNLTLILLFDRFEEYVSMVTPDFFTDLRILRNTAKYKFSAIFSLNRPLDQLLDPTIYGELTEVLHHTVFLPIYDEVGLSFRISYVERALGKMLPEGTKKEVISVTGGHGKLTRVAVEELFKQEKTAVNLLFQSAAIKEALKEIWSSLIPAERNHFTRDLFAKGFVDEHSVYLESIGLVKKGIIAIPLFSEFVEEQKLTAKKEASTIRFLKETNEIVKGDVTLSQQLTASEFRLLQFFLKHEGEIIDRDRIIQTAWTSTKTTEGVTDQALDQLIFRLRRKIEEDPNNPTHIVTVKGRGFRFSA